MNFTVSFQVGKAIEACDVTVLLTKLKIQEKSKTAPAPKTEQNSVSRAMIFQSCDAPGQIAKEFTRSFLSNFVDPRTVEHTNGIENCWSLMKKNLRRFYPIKNDDWLATYLYGYQFRFNFLQHHTQLDLYVRIIELMS